MLKFGHFVFKNITVKKTDDFLILEHMNVMQIGSFFFLPEILFLFSGRIFFSSCVLIRIPFKSIVITLE